MALVVGIVAVLALSLGAACSSDNNDGNGGDNTPTATEAKQASAEEIAAVEDTFTQTFESDATNAEYFFAHVTDNIIKNVLFAPSREECEANAAECIGDPGTVISIEGTQIDGDTATLTMTSDFGTFNVGLVRADGEWMADTFQATSDDVPEGTTLVDLTLGEFAFGFDETAIPADGNFAFHVNNAGGQTHEVIIIPIPAEGDLETILQSMEQSQEGPDPVAFKAFITPGEEVDMAFDAPLEAGRYALVCFFPDVSDPEMTPHAEKGMVNEFTIG